MPKILIISQGSAFMVNSIENNLKKEGMDIIRCEPDTTEIEICIENVDTVLLFAGEFIASDPEVLPYTVSKCNDECINFCIIGYPNEITEIEKQVDISCISAEFSRPFDMKDFTSNVKALTVGELASDPIQLKSAGSGKHHILLCDNDMMFIKTVQDSLSEKYRVSTVKTGLMAITLAQHDAPELILLDYEMPVMNGSRVLEELRRDRKTAQIPVVFLTGRSDKNSVMEVMKLKPKGCLLKSTKKEDMIASVDCFFESGQWKYIQV